MTYQKVDYRVVTHNACLLKLVRLLAKTAGRDKIFRCIQYLSRFLAYYFSTIGLLDHSRLSKSVSGDLSFIRKAFRFLKPLEHLVSLGKVLDAATSVDPISRTVSAFRDSTFIAYLFFDQVMFFKTLKLIDGKSFPNAAILSGRLWALAIGLGIVNDVKNWYDASSHLRQLETHKDGKNAEITHAIKSKKYAAKRKLLWDSLDLFVALNSGKLLHSNEGKIALAGTATSVMGLQDVWNAA
ncbi:Pex11 protein [Saccharomycopsis crataegensis]|uniref:Pex11 protein n=1 Tax=Saccharomycopsis crataegensis TaxID=43959 RepID=A0AAV5QHQ1_9ASCO|nr:Pex11 protein [Saccharomycopsis crataegensis]